MAETPATTFPAFDHGPLGVRLMRPEEVMAVFGIKRTKLKAEIDAGRIPRPIPNGPKSYVFPSNEIEQALRARLAAPREKLAKPGAKAE